MSPPSLSAAYESPASDHSETIVPANSPLVIVESTPDHAIGYCGNIALYAWRRLTRVAAVPAVLKAFHEAKLAGGGRFGNFGLVEPEAGMPDSEMRARLAHVMRDSSSSMMASSMTYEGTGLRAAAVRKAAMGLALIARQPCAHRVFATGKEAAEWFVGEMKRRGAPAPSATALDLALRGLQEAPPSK